MYQVYSLTDATGRMVYVGRAIKDEPRSVKWLGNITKKKEQLYGPVFMKVHLETEVVREAMNLVQSLNAANNVYDLREGKPKVDEPVMRVKRRPVVCGDGYPVNAFLVYDGAQLIRARS